MTESDDVESCSTVFAIRCGARPCGPEQDDNGEERGELTVMVGIGPISPSLHRDVELYRQQSEEVSEKRIQLSEQELNDKEELNDIKDEEDGKQLTTINTTASFYKPLQLPHQSSSALPISILSPTLITGTGGTSIDSSILLRRSIEVVLSLYKLDNGGIDFFASHSLEGGATTTTMEMDSTSTGGGGAANVQIEALVRRIADMAQSSTQNLGSKYGRMLSSSLLAMGVQQQSHPFDDEERNNGDILCIWRVDPTGQFWKCDASAVGRGTVEVEAELLSHVRRWKNKNEAIPLTNDGKIDNDSELDDQEYVRITNNDVRSYLSSLTENEAVRVASDCLLNGIMNCKGSPNEKLGGKSSSSLRGWMEFDLRRRMQCVILRSSCGVGSKQSSLMKSYEVVQRL